MMLAFLVSPLGKLLGYGLVALVLAGTLLGVKAEWDRGQTAIHQVSAISHNSAIQAKAVAKADVAVAKSDAKAQAKIVTETRIIHTETTRYVTASTPCIPWAVVRLHDAAVAGVDPSTLSLPAGATDDQCSTVAPAAFVAVLADNYAAARANAQQLDDLIADANAREKAVEPASVVAPASPLN